MMMSTKPVALKLAQSSKVEAMVSLADNLIEFRVLTARLHILDINTAIREPTWLIRSLKPKSPAL